MPSQVELSKNISPYNKRGKKQEIEQMFDTIAPHYDFLNHFLSLGIDTLWRKRALKQLKKHKPARLLDIATGTGDLAIQTVRTLGGEVEIIGLDISEQMLALGTQKVKKLGLEGQISFEKGDSENLRFEDESFDALTVAFGVRNFEDLPKGLKEMHRVLRRGGRLVILEFTEAKGIPGFLFNLYFHHILPWIGNKVSGEKRAYSYLAESVKAFPGPKEFTNLLSELGFNIDKKISLSLGVCYIYVCEKA